MPRMSRLVIPGCPHHIIQRGNRSEDVFFTVDDRLRFLELLAEYTQKHSLAVQAYCLMTNHLHLVVVPQTVDSLGHVMKPLLMRYAQHVNRTQGVAGRLWQGRFYSCPLDEEHLWAAVRYVELNPARAGIVDIPEAYRWSSAAGHCGLRTDEMLSDPCGMAANLSPKQWPQWLHEPCENQAEIERFAQLQRCTQSGRPAGGPSFISRLEKRIGRSLKPKKLGRPKKKKTKTGTK